jgi:hypothetical protein
MSAIFKMAAKTRYKKWAVKIQHCPISSKFDMWVDNDVPRYCGSHFENGDREKFFNVGNQFGTSLSTHISNFDNIGIMGR